MTDWIAILIAALAGLPGWIALYRDRPQRPRGKHRK